MKAPSLYFSDQTVRSAIFFSTTACSYTSRVNRLRTEDSSFTVIGFIICPRHFPSTICCIIHSMLSILRLENVVAVLKDTWEDGRIK